MSNLKLIYLEQSPHTSNTTVPILNLKILQSSENPDMPPGDILPIRVLDALNLTNIDGALTVWQALF